MNTPNNGGETGEHPYPVFRPIRQVTVFWQGKRLTARALRPTPADAQQLSTFTRQVAQEGWLGSSDPLGDADHTLQFIRASARNGSVLMGLFDSRLLVGHLGLDRWLEPEGGTEAGLVLYLARPYRGAGLGKALLQIGLAAAYRLGIRKVHAATHPRNQAAAALYQTVGFRQLAPVTPADGGAPAPGSLSSSPGTAGVQTPPLGEVNQPADPTAALLEPAVYWVAQLDE